MPAVPAPQGKPDRYASFKDIDCVGNTQRVMARIEHHTRALTDDRFWKYFYERRGATRGVRCDDLLLLASFVNPIRELFEACGDHEALHLLEQLEDECF